MIQKLVVAGSLTILLSGFCCINASAQQIREVSQPIVAADSVQLELADIPPGLIVVRSRIEQLRLEHQTRAAHLPVPGLHSRVPLYIIQPAAQGAVQIIREEAFPSAAVVPAEQAPEALFDSPEHALRADELERLVMMLELLESTDASGLADIATVPLDFSYLSLQIPFEVNSASLPDEVLPGLENVGEWLLRHPQLKLEIAGHTDISGTRALNMSLSEARARAVRSFLLTSFPELAPERLTARGLGPDQPVADNATPEGRAQNRRVTFTLVD